MRVLLLAGGWSPEAEISLRGAESIKKALEERGHIVNLYDPQVVFDAIVSLAKEHDVTFINMHGCPGEDGLIQSLLSNANCAYQGSDGQSSFLALHKAASKQIFRLAGINTPDWHFLPTRPGKNWKPDLIFPLFVKSNTGGSSLNMAKVENLEQLHKEMDSLFEKNLELILEPLIEGEEVTCGVLEIKNEVKALPPILIRPKNDTFFDYTNKYAADGADEICPAPLPEEIILKIQENSVKAHKALGLSGYSRSDFILTKDGQLFILETNTIPGMTSTSLIPQEAKVVGYSFGELIEILLESAINKAK